MGHRIKDLARQELLIVDELGSVPLYKTGAEMLFEVFSQRYEHSLTYCRLVLFVDPLAIRL
jgi:DNA replication protein DnaC